MSRYYAYAGYAGCVTQRRSRSTGFMVGLYHAEQAGLDPDSGPWATVCEEHNWSVNHPTLALARSHLGDPAGWCEPCGAIEDRKNQESISGHSGLVAPKTPDDEINTRI